jgi:hypothetical protein
MQQLRCALLFLLFGTLLSSASCGDEQAAPTSGAAGLVIAVQGEVSAKRGDEAPRPLAIDDVIYVKDTVKTGEGASLAIAFKHNNATWNVDASQEKAVTRSIAWRAQKVAASHFDDKEKLAAAAAGRDTEKSALESGDTIMRDQAEVAPPGGAETTAVNSPLPPPPPPHPDPAATPDKTIATKQKPKRPKRRNGKKPKPKPDDPLRLTPPNSPPPKTSDADDPVPKKKADFLVTIARQCQAKKKGSGTLSYTLEVASGKLLSFEAEAPDDLVDVVSCMRAKLKAADLLKVQSKSGSITLP